MQIVQTQLRRATDLLVEAIRGAPVLGDLALRNEVRRALELVVEATLRQASGSALPLPPPPPRPPEEVEAEG